MGPGRGRLGRDIRVVEGNRAAEGGIRAGLEVGIQVAEEDSPEEDIQAEVDSPAVGDTRAAEEGPVRRANQVRADQVEGDIQAAVADIPEEDILAAGDNQPAAGDTVLLLEAVQVAGEGTVLQPAAVRVAEEEEHIGPAAEADTDTAAELDIRRAAGRVEVPDTGPAAVFPDMVRPVAGYLPWGMEPEDMVGLPTAAPGVDPAPEVVPAAEEGIGTAGIADLEAGDTTFLQ